MYQTVRISGLTQSQMARVRRAAEDWAAFEPQSVVTAHGFVKVGRAEYAPLREGDNVHDTARGIGLVAGRLIDYEVVTYN